MNDVIIAATPDNIPAAERLADRMKIDLSPIEASKFPDDELRIRATAAASTTILYHSLDHPNEKLVAVILAASALRDLGAKKIVLVAPYLCYMRQDKAFSRGEAVSQSAIAKLISQWVDHIVTVEPHLHRVKALQTVFPDIMATALSASPLLATMIRECSADKNFILIGPDEEARAWTASTAQEANVPFTVLKKTRHGDRSVTVAHENDLEFQKKRVCFIDDVVSTGATFAAAAKLLREMGATSIEALAVHALCSADDLNRLKGAGVERIRSTDTVPHPTNAACVASLIAEALLRELAR